MEKIIIGRSWLGTGIEALKVGSGLKTAVLIGGMSAMDTATPTLLKAWISQLDEKREQNAEFGDFLAAPLCAKITVYVVPDMNPDGRLTGTLDGFNPFKERVERIKNNSKPSEWTANIRGAELSRNFRGRWLDAKMHERSEGIFTSSPSGYGGEYPESELETSSLCHFLRGLRPNFICVFSDADKGIYLSGGDDAKKRAEFISKLKNIRINELTRYERAATLPVWAYEELETPAFTVGTGGEELLSMRELITLCVAL